MRRPQVEILFFEGCPNHEPARLLVQRLARQLRIEQEIRVVEVVDPDAAIELRFLGSPTIRVDGADVEPGAMKRRDFALSCRIYRSEHGVSEQPEEAWVRNALTEAGR
jgi:hypothetical protein